MSGRRTSFRPLPVAAKGLASDIAVVLLWRFGGKHSWAASLTVGGVLLSLTAAVAAYAWWLQRHPEARQRLESQEAAAAERLAQNAAAVDAATRASGREPFRR